MSSEGHEAGAGSEGGAAAIESVGFVGLGAMGAWMAGRLIAHGCKVYVHDASEVAMAKAVAQGAIQTSGPAALADMAEAVFMSLPTPDVVRHVATGPGGVIEGKRARILVDLSTTGPTVAREVAELLAPKGIVCLDAPVSGGPAGAEAGSLAIMASGDRNAFKRVEPCLRAMGRNLTYVGLQVGQGQTLKLANNLLAATTFLAAVEVFAFGTKAGLSPSVMVKVINNSSGRSAATERLIPEAVVTRAFAYGFRLELMAKDVRLSLDEAARLGIAQPVSAASRSLWAQALEQGDGPRDFTYLARLIEERSGIEIAEHQMEDGDGH